MGKQRIFYSFNIHLNDRKFIEDQINEIKEQAKIEDLSEVEGFEEDIPKSIETCKEMLKSISITSDSSVAFNVKFIGGFGI